MVHRTRERKMSTPLLSSGKRLKFSETNPRHFPAVIFFLLLEDTGANSSSLAQAGMGSRGTATQLQCCTERWSQNQPGLPNLVPLWLEEPQ